MTEKQSMPPFLIFTIYSIDCTVEISLIDSTHVLIVIIDSFRTAKSFLWPIFLDSGNFIAFSSVEIENSIDGYENSIDMR